MVTPALAAIAEPRREEILRMVWHGEMRAGDIARAMPVTFGAVSQHLRVLLEAGLVTVRREGKSRLYKADHGGLGPLAAVLEQFWFGRLSTLKALAEVEQRKTDSARAAATPLPAPRRQPPRTRRPASNARPKPRD